MQKIPIWCKKFCLVHHFNTEAFSSPKTWYWLLYAVSYFTRFYGPKCPVTVSNKHFDWIILLFHYPIVSYSAGNGRLHSRQTRPNSSLKDHTENEFGRPNLGRGYRKFAYLQSISEINLSRHSLGKLSGWISSPRPMFGRIWRLWMWLSEWVGLLSEWMSACEWVDVGWWVTGWMWVREWVDMIDWVSEWMSE